MAAPDAGRESRVARNRKVESDSLRRDELLRQHGANAYQLHYALTPWDVVLERHLAARVARHNAQLADNAFDHIERRRELRSQTDAARARAARAHESLVHGGYRDEYARLRKLCESDASIRDAAAQLAARGMLLRDGRLTDAARALLGVEKEPAPSRDVARARRELAAIRDAARTEMRRADAWPRVKGQPVTPTDAEVDAWLAARKASAAVGNKHGLDTVAATSNEKFKSSATRD